MNPSPENERRIYAWLDQLAELTRRGSEAVTADQIDTVARALLQDPYPLGAYCSRSLHHVAQSFRYFPSYGEIRDGLAGWWDANRPRAAPAIEGPDLAHLSPEDQGWVRFYHTRRAEILDAGYEPKRGSVANDLENLNSLLRVHAYPAYAQVTYATKYTSGTHPDETTRAGVAAAVAEVELILNQNTQIAPEAPGFTPKPVSSQQLGQIRQSRVSRHVNESLSVDLNGG